MKPFLLVAALLACAVRAEAQAAPSDDAAARCPAAERMIERAETVADFRVAMPRLIGSCGGGAVTGRALASAMLRVRRSPDNAALSLLWDQAYWLLDARLFAAAEEVAADPRASVPARIHALRTLLLVGRQDMDAEFERMTPGVDRVTGEPGVCEFRRRIHRYGHVGVPISGDVVPRVAAIAEALYRDSAQPAEVRVAARCVYQNIDPKRYGVTDASWREGITSHCGRLGAPAEGWLAMYAPYFTSDTHARVRAGKFDKIPDGAPQQVVRDIETCDRVMYAVAREMRSHESWAEMRRAGFDFRVFRYGDYFAVILVGKAPPNPSQPNYSPLLVLRASDLAILAQILA